MATKVEQTSFDLLGKRWSALIVQDLIQGPRRFRELLGDLGRINDKVLSQRLKELEGRGIIDRRLFAEVPVRVEYKLTEKGRGLAAVISAMEQWDADWSNGKSGNGTGPLGNGHAGSPDEGINVLGSSRAAVAEKLRGDQGSPLQRSRGVEPVQATGLKGGKSLWKRLGL